MAILQINNVSRVYKTESGDEKYALKNFTVVFPSSGLVAITGKSGSGKSTLLNLIALLDSPTKGEVLYNGKNVSSLSELKRNEYRNREIGIIFQHYHLLEEQTALFNVALPMLIKGQNEKSAFHDAKKLLEGINFPKDLFGHKCSDLSGGEKERIAILRSLINNPKIVLADEPTGALDSYNSNKTMELLKKASKKKLVIMVSHNQGLVEKYADQIIKIKDGELISNKIIHEGKNGVPNSNEKKTKKNKGWINRLAIHNFKKRFKRNAISIASLVVGLAASMLIIGFSNGSPTSIAKESVKQLDYGAMTVTKEVTTDVTKNGLSITQTLKPTNEESESLKQLFPSYRFMENYDSLVPYALDIKKGNTKIEKLYYQPICSFVDKSIDKSLLVEGRFPKIDSLNEVVINNEGFNLLKKLGYTPLKISLNLSYNYVNHYYPDDDILNPVITDYFVYEKEVQIVGVVKELDFLSSAKIYYPYVALDNYLDEIMLPNLSSYQEEDISWKEVVTFADINSPISSYSVRMFLKNHQDVEMVKKAYSNVRKPFSITSNPILISNALEELINASSMGMDIFLVIALLGTALILGIVSFSSYSEDKKISAILSCIGAHKNDITDIYIFESVIIGLIATAISIALAPFLSYLLNFVIQKTLGFSNIIDIPIMSFSGVPFLFPLILFLITLVVCFISTYLPIFFSKKISLKEELADE